jgi:hypothetical protein
MNHSPDWLQHPNGTSKTDGVFACLRARRIIMATAIRHHTENLSNFFVLFSALVLASSSLAIPEVIV